MQELMRSEHGTNDADLIRIACRLNNGRGQGQCDSREDGGFSRSDVAQKQVNVRQGRHWGFASPGGSIRFLKP